MEPFALTNSCTNRMAALYHHPNLGFFATIGKVIDLACLTFALIGAFVLDGFLWPFSSSAVVPERPQQQYVPTHDAGRYDQPKRSYAYDQPKRLYAAINSSAPSAEELEADDLQRAGYRSS